MYGWDATGLSGWWILVVMGIFALVVLGSVWLIVRRPRSSESSPSAADELLRERYARGELTGEQFDEAKGRLRTR